MGKTSEDFFGKFSGKASKPALLNALFLGVPANQGVEDREDMPPVFDHAVENVAQLGVALGVAMPLQQDGLGDLDVPAKLLRRMAA